MPAIQISNADYTVAQGQTMLVVNGDAFRFQAIDTNDSAWLTIAGEVRLVSNQTAPVSPGYVNAINVGYSSFYAASRIQVTSTGSIRVDASASGDVAYAVNAGSWTPRLINEGLIEVIARNAAFGLYNWGSYDDTAPAVLNSGTVKLVSQGSAQGVTMAAGEWLQNTGLIDVFGTNSARGVVFAQSNSDFRNLGEIRVGDANPDVASVGVLFQSNVRSFFFNGGLIEADVALKVVTGDAGSLDTFQNGGRMVGAVELGVGRQMLVNSGSIAGPVDMGAGSDTYAGSTGSVSGLVSGGDGNDSLAGGAGFDNLQGNVGDDIESGGGGDDWVVGGKDNDILYGNEGADIVYGNVGDDICVGGDGADLLRGGQGQDRLVGDAGADWLSGDRDNDTMTGGAGADVFHTFGEAGIDRVTDFSLAEGDRVQLDPGTQYTLAQVGADTAINMTGGGQMILVGVQLSSLTPGWIFGS